MNIVGVSACATGIAHTYMAQKKLVKAAEKLGYSIKIETQGTIGIENELNCAEIENADVVILAVDIKIVGEERFKGKPIVRVSTEQAIKNPIGLIKTIDKKMKERG